MQRLLSVWKGLTLRQRIIVITATVAMFVAILGMSRMASSPTMAVLYSGLEPDAAGQVVAALEQQNVAHQVRGNSIYVDVASRDSLRITLASQGLPANGTKGYELLDSLTGFGTTSRMFDAAYWRAKEGELARTIAASAQVAMARVHLAVASGDPFRNNEPPSASVTVKPNGGGISDAHTRSLTFLVASSVAGLSPDRVTIMDTNGTLLGVAAGNEASGVAKGQSEDMRTRILRLLEARVGSGNAVVEVSIDTEHERQEITERVVDPNSVIAISTDTEERNNESNGTSSGGVTVASNLPDGDAASDNGNSREQGNETRERVNYEFSETQREISRPAGAIKRITLAILVNHQSAPDGSGGTELQPRSEQELSDLRELVASAAGLDEARGDQLTIKSMAFEPVKTEGTAAVSSASLNQNLDVMSLVKLAILALVSLGLGVFVIRPILSKATQATVPQLPSEALTGVVEFEDLEQSQNQASQKTENLPDLSRPDPMERFRELIGDRQDESIQILQAWLTEKGEKV